MNRAPPSNFFFLETHHWHGQNTQIIITNNFYQCIYRQNILLQNISPGLGQFKWKIFHKKYPSETWTHPHTSIVYLHTFSLQESQEDGRCHATTFAAISFYVLFYFYFVLYWHCCKNKLSIYLVISDFFNFFSFFFAKPLTKILLYPQEHRSSGVRPPERGVALPWWEYGGDVLKHCPLWLQFPRRLLRWSLPGRSRLHRQSSLVWTKVSECFGQSTVQSVLTIM